MYVKPRSGYLVVDPDSKRVLPPEGDNVPDFSVYWHRRLIDGDVILADQPPAESKKATKGDTA